VHAHIYETQTAETPV